MMQSGACLSPAWQQLGKAGDVLAQERLCSGNMSSSRFSSNRSLSAALGYHQLPRRSSEDAELCSQGSALLSSQFFGGCCDGRSCSSLRRSSDCRSPLTRTRLSHQHKLDQQRRNLVVLSTLEKDRLATDPARLATDPARLAASLDTRVKSGRPLDLGIDVFRSVEGGVEGAGSSREQDLATGLSALNGFNGKVAAAAAAAAAEVVAATLEADVDPARYKGILGSWNKFTDSFSPRVRGLILLNILTFLYGSNVTVIKEAQGGLDPFTFSSVRFAIAAFVFAPFLKDAFKEPSVRLAGFELGIWAAIAYTVQAVGLITTDAGRAAFIGTFTVIEVPIIAGLFGVKIPKVTWASAFAAVVGVGLLESSGGNSSLAGDFWTIMSALVFGVHMLRSEHHAKHVPQGKALSLIALQLAVITGISAIWTLGMHVGVAPVPGVNAILHADMATISTWPWWQMAYTGVLSTAFCLWVEVVSLRDVSASEAAMVYTLEPLYGASFAWVLLGERWGMAGWVGAALILGGSVTMQLFGQIEDLPPEESTPPSSSAILAALAAAAALALLLAATSTPESLTPMKHVLGVAEAAEAAEIDNLTTFFRAYALLKIDVEDGMEF